MPTALVALALTPLLCADVPANSEFEAPEVVTTAGDTFKDIIFPTPVLQDVDGDEQRELVIGDLRGHLMAYERGEDADVAWAKAENFQSDGKPLKLNNW